MCETENDAGFAAKPTRIPFPALGFWDLEKSILPQFLHLYES